ncbi:MAG: hypothetical protein ACRDO8_11085, partial [Nocardioidaceae bacterium]
MRLFSWRSAAALGGTVGAAAAAGIGSRVVADRSRARRRARRGEDVGFGSLHSAARVVPATDGVALNVEVDDPETGGAETGGAETGDAETGDGGTGSPAVPTVVFVHGWV